MKKKTFPLFSGKRKLCRFTMYYYYYYNILLALLEECCVTLVGGALRPRRSIPTSAIVATNSDAMVQTEKLMTVLPNYILTVVVTDISSGLKSKNTCNLEKPHFFVCLKANCTYFCFFAHHRSATTTVNIWFGRSVISFLV